MSDLLERISNLSDSQAFFNFGLESTGRYGDHLAIAIRESSCISHKYKKVHLLNPKQVKRFKDSYAELPKNDSTDAFIIADCLRFGRIGPVYSAGIIAEIGDISRFNNQAALAKYAGLAWNENQSGSFKAENTPGIQSGNRYFRYYLLEATNKVRLHEATFAEYYAKKYK